MSRADSYRGLGYSGSNREVTSPSTTVGALCHSNKDEKLKKSFKHLDELKKRLPRVNWKEGDEMPRGVAEE